ncbi:MAG: sugar phosphate isomerase/epimerase [Ruminococcaceae bacterium]|nr:sugar phosphate isomerase/epimerase [Oscillospiraceae bacterium]
MKEHNIKLGVSLYSYQEAIWRGDLDLEGALTAVKGAGGAGVEIFGEALIRSFPYITDEFLYKWYYMLDNLGLEPVCYEHFADRRFSPDPAKYLTDDDLFDVTMMYLESAKKLGCKFIRLSHTGHNGMYDSGDPGRRTVTAETFMKVLPYAEEMGVKMALEVHAPGLLEDGGNDDFLEALERTGCYGGGGLMLDFSGCFRDMSPMTEAAHIKAGAKPEIITYLREMSRKAYTFDGNNDVDWDEVEAKIKEMGASDIELNILNGQGSGHGSLRNKLISPPSVVQQYASQLIYCHGKMHWINEDCTCDEMDYARYIKALVDGGFEGWICSEFEGQRSVPHTLNEVMFVNRQHQLMRKCLEEACKD